MGEQRFDLDPQRAVGAAGLGQKTCAFFNCQFQGRQIQFLNVLPTVGSHRSALNSRNSHTLALFQSRITVSGEILRTSAVSTTLSPPKNRSSTTWLIRGSISAIALSASSSAIKSGSLPEATGSTSSSVT